MTSIFLSYARGDGEPFGPATLYRSDEGRIRRVV